MHSALRVLHYNWADYRDPSGRGGGVTVYQRAILDAFAARGDVSATFLSAGLAQSLRPGTPRWEALPEVPGETTQRFQLVDTQPLSPAHHAFGCHEQIEHAPTVDAFARFVDAEGPFDVIHFNTLEGLPASVLALRARWPQTRFVVALHNYYPFCPQVNLWQREHSHCSDYADGAACVSCLPVRRDPARMRTAYGVMRGLDRIGLRKGSFAYDRLLQPLVRLGADTVRKMSDRVRARAAARHAGAGAGAAAETGAEATAASGDSKAAAFAERRAAFVAALNAHVDCVLAVSERTAALARGFGVDAARIAVRWIGTDHAPLYTSTAPPARLPAADGTLGLGYLGYMRRDKGFFFLLDALERMRPDVLSRLRLTVAAQSRDARTVARLQALEPRLAGLRHLEGYRRDGLDDVLRGVDLGLVPVLWEDNLPQVAMEMHARRIPLLTSDRGGARELGNCAALVFRAGDAADLERRIAALLDTGMDLGPYWDGARALLTPAEHADRLVALYRALHGVAATSTARDTSGRASPGEPGAGVAPPQAGC